MIGYIFLFARLPLTVIWIALITVPLFLTRQLNLNRLNSRMMMFSFDVGCLLWGINIKISGMISPERPVLIVSNHFSYLDVFALGSRIPAKFITKSEIASWPVIGMVCRMGGCIFIDRRRHKTLHNMSEIHQAVRKKSVICLFSEGTTNDGTRLLPFKSSFFSIAEDMGIEVQPVTILYTALNGKPLTEHTRPVVGWYGDALFFPHMLRLLRERSVDVTLIFHEPVNRNLHVSRKAIATYCKDVIGKTLHAT